MTTLIHIPAEQICFDEYNTILYTTDFYCTIHFMHISIHYWKTAFGELVLGSFNNRLCLCDWRYRKMRQTIDNRIKSYLQADFTEEETEVISEAKCQLTEYFEGIRKVFDLPLLPAGSEFQKSVWNILMDIPWGTVTTYREQSERLGKPEAVRAVASANGANAFAILIPCHRVIGCDGQLTGYAGGLKTKEKLLELEKTNPQYSLDF